MVERGRNKVLSKYASVETASVTWRLLWCAERAQPGACTKTRERCAVHAPKARSLHWPICSGRIRLSSSRVREIHSAEISCYCPFDDYGDDYDDAEQSRAPLCKKQRSKVEQSRVREREGERTINAGHSSPGRAWSNLPHHRCCCCCWLVCKQRCRFHCHQSSVCVALASFATAAATAAEPYCESD